MSTAQRLYLFDAPYVHALRDEDSGVRRRPTAADDLPDLTHLTRIIEPPPVPHPARKLRRPPRPPEKVDFERLLTVYRPRAAATADDDYFPPVPGIPPVLVLPREEEPALLDGARVAVLVGAAVAGALLAFL